MSTDQEFLETVATVIETIKEMAIEIGVEDRLFLSCFVGLLEDGEETGKLSAVFDFVLDSDDEYQEVSDFMDSVWEDHKKDPPAGTIDWWIDRLN